MDTDADDFPIHHPGSVFHQECQGIITDETNPGHPGEDAAMGASEAPICKWLFFAYPRFLPETRSKSRMR